MKRRAFMHGCAAAILAATRPELARTAATTLEEAEEADEAPIIVRKPWPRPPVKRISFDEKKIPSYSAMAALTPLPGTQRIYLQQPCDYKIVTARPDLKFLVYNAISHVPVRSMHLTGYGFVIARDSKAISFDYNSTGQRFEKDHLPLLTQRISRDGLIFEQRSFTTTDATGRPLLMVRLAATRQANQSPRTVELAWLTVRDTEPRFYSYWNEDYIVFEPWGRAWESALKLTPGVSSQRDGDILFDVFKHTKNVSASASRSLAGSSLIFSLSFAEEQEASIDIFIPYEGLQRPVTSDDHDLCYREEKAFRVSEERQLLSMSFEDEYRRQIGLWNEKFEDTAAVETPEKVVQDIYHVLTANELQFLGSGAKVSYLKPGQGGFNSFSTVYGWESSSYLPMMDQQGFHNEVGRVLDYFLTTQQGPDGSGPEGDISTPEGCFHPHVDWMCETGAILGIFAEHAILSGDFERLRKDGAALLRAARWIQGQRARTKDFLPDGTKSIHYGLMPAGRATDWPTFAYSLFTDAYTWQGLDKLARAFEAAEFLEAKWLRAEADDYRQCILESMKKVLNPTPFAPSQKKEKPVLFSPEALLDTGLINGTDELVKVIEAALRRSGVMDDLFAHRMRKMEDANLAKMQEKAADGPIDLYYVNSSEKVWHRVWLERGERVKALRYFYMTLAYSTSRDVHLTAERFCPQLIWLLPWQPNGSGNGRILSMIINTLCLENGDSMKLLHGVPDAWFAADKSIGVKRLRTGFGVFSFNIKPVAGKARLYEFSYESTPGVPKHFLVALPNGKRQQARRVIEINTQKRKRATYTIDIASGRIFLGSSSEFSGSENAKRSHS